MTLLLIAEVPLDGWERRITVLPPSVVYIVQYFRTIITFTLESLPINLVNRTPSTGEWFFYEGK